MMPSSQEHEVDQISSENLLLKTCTRQPRIANRHRKVIGSAGSAIYLEGGTCRQASKNGDTDVVQHLLELLQYDSKMLAKDTATCLRSAQFLDNKTKARAAAMIRNTN